MKQPPQNLGMDPERDENEGRLISFRDNSGFINLETNRYSVPERLVYD